MKLEGYSHHLLNIIPLNNGILEPDTEFTDYNYQEACEKLGITPISPTFDYIAYRQVVGEIASKHLLKAMEPILEILPFQIDLNVKKSKKKIEMDNTSLFLEYNVDRNFYKYVVAFVAFLGIDNQVKFEQFLQENFGSYDGFHSFMPATIEDVIAQAKDKDTRFRSLAVILAYLVHSHYTEEELQEIKSAFYCDVNENIFADEFYAEINQMTEVIAKADSEK